jgi:L-rhamnose mutarotase
MKRLITLAACAALAVIGAGLVRAQSDAPYTEGPVWGITMVKTKPGMSDDYLKTLAKIYKSTNDEMKKQGLIMDYKVFLGNDSNPQDFDILLMVEYKNMAAFDGLREKADPIADKILGNEDAQRQGAIKRMEIREIMGNKLMREVTLK